MTRNNKAREYQNKIAPLLGSIFGDDQVKLEWDSVKYDGHTTNHISVYGPRIDIAVGPFNSYMDIDIGNDKPAKLKKHKLVKTLIKKVFADREDFDKIWNKTSRCFIAIEIDFSGSSKHILGSIINATVSGAIGIWW